MGLSEAKWSRRTTSNRGISKSCTSPERLRAGFDAADGEGEIMQISDVPVSANVAIFMAVAWSLVFGLGCIFRAFFAIHWKGYIHVLMPIAGFIASLSAMLGFILPEDKSAKAVLVSIISWICCVIVAAGLILLSIFVFLNFKVNKAMEGVRNTFLYIILWLLFTDLLCVVTIVLDVLATVAAYKIWKNKR